MMKAASIHLEMVFSRIMNGSTPEKQGNILETLPLSLTRTWWFQSRPRG
jgi:hypothetical protein